MHVPRLIDPLLFAAGVGAVDDDDGAAPPPTVMGRLCAIPRGD
eukprot:COSAG01_NODE_43844_length_425_cov_1.825153_1_plen_42_part_10